MIFKGHSGPDTEHWGQRPLLQKRILFTKKSI